MKTYSQLFQELESYSKKFLENQLNKWQIAQARQFDTFDSIYKRVVEAIKNYDRANPFSPWSDLGNSFRDLNNWIKSININSSDITFTFDDWHEQTQHFFSSFPSNIEEEVKEDFWFKENNDTFFIGSWKFYNRRKNGFKNFLFAGKNVFRKILKKPAADKKTASKSILTQDFFDYYFTLPFLSSVHDIWQKHLQIISRHLAEIHKETEHIVHPLFADGKFEALINSDTAPLLNLIRHLNNFSQIVKDFQDKYNVFQKETLSANKLYLTRLKNDSDHKWKYAGTFILPVRKFNANRFKSSYKKFEKNFIEINTDWQKHIDGEKSDWQKDNELSMVQLYAGHLCHITISSLKSKLDVLLPSFIDPRIMIENTLRDMKAGNFKTADTFSEKIHSINRTILRDLHREKLPQLADAIGDAQFAKTMENYLSQMENELENLSKEYTVFRSQDLENRPPESKFIDIPLKDLITDEFYAIIEDSLKPQISNLINTTDWFIRAVSENDQIIELNFDTALELLESSEENPLNKAISVATEGLERAAKQLSDLIDESNSSINGSIESLLKETLNFEAHIQDLSDNDKIIALKIRAEKAKTQDKIRQTAITAIQKIKGSLPGLLKIIFDGLKKIQVIYFRIRRVTGLAESSAEAEDQLSQFLYHINKQLKRLPFVYQRLFRFQPLEDERFFAGREDEMQQLKNQLDHWKNGNFALTAIVGEKGSGRTTILNFAEKEFYNNLHLVPIDLASTIYKEDELFKILSSAFEMNDCKNLDDLEEKLQKRENSCICVLENLHNMFLRIPEGFAAMERFLLLISNTHQKVHWITTCGIYSWHYLDKVLNISKFFHKSITLPELKQNSIRDLIMKRHRASGYKLFFETPAGLENNRKFKKLATDKNKQMYLGELFFEKLSEMSAGNVTVAFLFWLSSIKEIKDDFLIVSPVNEFETLFVKNISGDDLFTFAAFLQHETLTAQQHAIIFNQDLQKSLLVFNRLKNKGMLSEKNDGYQVHYLLYRPVVRTLKINNLLL
jgi:hypothetical protein